MGKFAVLGAGQMGMVIAKELLDNDSDTTVSLYDLNSITLEDAAIFIASERLNTQVVDICDPAITAAALTNDLSCKDAEGTIPCHNTLPTNNFI